jgi:hypothetical protein
MGRALNSESGLSLLEVMMAALVLTIALLAAAMTMGQGVAAMYFTQEQLIAKQKAREAIESVFTARSTQNIIFDDIENVADGGQFVAGFQPIRAMGDDGIANTADDATEPIETIELVGPDGIYDTADDEVRTLTGFERRITINNVLLTSGEVDPDVREIVVEVRYSVRGYSYTVAVRSYISTFA